jgi:hypothetical protein
MSTVNRRFFFGAIAGLLAFPKRIFAKPGVSIRASAKPAYPWLIPRSEELDEEFKNQRDYLIMPCSNKKACIII